MRTRSTQIIGLLVSVLILALGRPCMWAADQTWKGTTDNQWNNTANWSGGALPASTDSVIYNNLSSANLSNWLASAFSIKGIVLTNPSGPVSINGTSTLTLGAGGITMSNATQPLTLSAPVALNGNQNWYVANNQALSVPGVISGTSTLFKGTNGTLVLSGNNTFTGSFTDDGGPVWINNSGALGTGSKTITVANSSLGAGLHLNGTNGNITLAGTLGLTLSQQNGAIFNEAGDNVVNGPITVAIGGGYVYIVANAGTLTLNGGVSLNTTPRAFALGGAANGTLNGKINNSTGLPFRKVDAGTWTMTNNNVYNGYTTIEGGTLVLAPTARIASTTNITVFANATLDVSAVTNSAGSNALFLAANQVLAGSGTINGSVATVSSASLQPGSLNTAQNAGGMGVTGTLTISSNLVMGSTVTSYCELNTATTVGGGVNDLINVGGDLDPQNAQIYISALSPLTTGTPYRLFNYGGALLSSFNPTVASDARYSFTLDQSVPNQVNLTASGGSAALLWSGGAASHLWDLNTTFNWNANALSFFNWDQVAFDDSAATGSVTLTGTVKPASVTFSNSSLGYIMDGSGKITGATGLTKWNSGTLIISNTASDYTGPVSIYGGVLGVSSVAANGSASSLGAGTSLTLDGGTFQYGGAKPANSAFNRLVTLGPGGGTISATNQTFFLMNTISGPGSLTKGGSAQVILGDVVAGVLTNANNNYTGDTFVTQGDLQIRNAHGLGFGRVFVSNGADLSVGGGANYGIVTNDIALNGGDGAKGVGAIMVNDASTVVSFSGTINLLADSSVGSVTVPPISFTISGPIIGSGKLTKLATATVTLTSPNSTYSGGTLVSAGTLDVKADGGLGAGDVAVASGATLKLEAGTANTYISSSANLLLAAGSPVVNLAFSGTPNSINGLSFDGGATFKAAGTWGSPTSGAAHTDSHFSGNGMLNVLSGPASTTAIASSLNPALYGSAVTFTSTVTPASVTGTVTFKDGAALLGTAILSGGQATLTLNTLAVTNSPHSLTAVYSGDTNFNPSTSSPLSQVVNPAVLTVSGLAAQSKTYDGNASATVTGSPALSGILFSEDVSLSGTAGGLFTDPNVGTNKSVAISGLSLIGANSGNYSFAPLTVSADINAAASSTGLTSSQNPSTETSNVTFTATLNSAAGTPGGGVVFLANGVPFSTNNLVGGVAAASTSLLSVGTNTVAAQFSAQGNFLASSNQLQQVVQSAVIYSQTNYILGITNNLDSTLTLTFLGTPQAQYYVLASADLTQATPSWAALADSTNTVTNISGIWSYTVTNSNSQQFYRSAAVAPQP